ncbi:MAG: hypothetical protein M1828_003272 [Chrysothrix sp. TS-e1954]|nr:MAG: hypothetical protein M1828_003272 [Chrysothrix sp. TS-e1954]
MTIFKSLQPDIDLPTNITIWDWLFDSPHSSLRRESTSSLAGYTDAITKDRITYLEVAEASTNISTALVRDYGFKAGDTLSLFSRNTIWYPVAMFAGIRVGGMVSGASPAYNVEEMTYALKTASAKFLATSPTSMDVAKKAAEAAGIPQRHIFLLEGSMPGYTSIKDLAALGKSYGPSGQTPAFRVPSGKLNKDVCAFLSFSSGTTGLPKAVMISHQNVIAQSLQIRQITPSTHKKVLAVLPLFHITGLVHGMNLPIAINAEVIMLPEFTMPSMLRTIQDYGIEEVLLVPPIIIRLVRDPEVEKWDLSCVKRFSSGAAPLSEEVLQLLQKKFPGTGFKQGYGMTESCSCITAHPPSHYDYKYAHAGGTIVASTDVKFLKEDGAYGGVGEPGEILARGPQVVMGYLNNEKATSETFDKDGFLHTGDQGSIDEGGVVTILDRIKEMIKVKGIGVAPAELEDTLLGHEAVEDVAVMGILDDYSGELPKAFIVLKSDSKGKNAEKLGHDIMTYVQSRKSRHKWIKEVEFVPEIPKSASGKILRRVLRDKAKSGEKGVVVRAAPSEKARL